MNRDIYKKATNNINNINPSNEGSDPHIMNEDHKRFQFAISSFFNYLSDIEEPNKNRILAKIKKDTLNYSLCEKKIDSKAANKLSIKFQIWSAAAILIILSVGSFNYLYKKGQIESNIIVQAQPNEKLIFFLPDSSEVWLNKGSKLQYKSDFSENREVRLTGEAYFDVRKNKNKSFEVKTNNADLKVLGTTFNIKSDNSGDVEVKLYTGKVNVTIQHSEQITLSPMQKLNYIASKTETTLNRIDDDFDWKSNIYKFTDKPLDELILILNQLYNVQIKVKRTAFNKNVFSGKITLSEPINNILDKICINTGLTLSHTHNSIILY
jgi:ferric-dicitrate binding protein FerR (iron transport regulator)